MAVVKIQDAGHRITCYPKTEGERHNQILVTVGCADIGSHLSDDSCNHIQGNLITYNVTNTLSGGP